MYEGGAGLLQSTEMGPALCSKCLMYKNTLEEARGYSDLQTALTVQPAEPHSPGSLVTQRDNSQSLPEEVPFKQVARNVWELLG
jgi:hypothetical protein